MGQQTSGALMTEQRRRVLQMRLVVEADDYDEAVRFYRDVLGADRGAEDPRRRR